jgi:hypothetical protein
MLRLLAAAPQRLRGGPAIHPAWRPARCPGHTTLGPGNQARPRPPYVGPPAQPPPEVVLPLTEGSETRRLVACGQLRLAERDHCAGHPAQVAHSD